MKTVNFRIPTSIKDIKQLFREKRDRRYNHNVQVVRNMYREIIDTMRESQRNFKETKAFRDCLTRGIKAID